VQEKGVAKVGIVLNGDWHLDSIATAQKSLMAELAGSKHEVISNSTIGPYTSLEIGPDAPAVLESSSLVKDVYVEEMVFRPALLQRMPLIDIQLHLS